MGLLDWFTESLASDPSAGFNRLGVLGAALQDFGAAQQGGQGNALATFAQQQQRRAAPQNPRADVDDGGDDESLGWLTKPLTPSAGFNRLGVLGAALQDFGAAQQGGQGSALANFAQQQRRYAAPYLNSPYGGAGGYGSQPMMRNGYYPTAPRARLQTVPDVAPRQAVPGPFQI